MILAPKTDTGLFRIRVKGLEFEIDKSQLKKLADVPQLKTTVNSMILSKGWQMDFYYNPPNIMAWIGRSDQSIPTDWWINEEL